ncbi:MAG: hypothetical protein RLY31_1056 [Bacteroidota bacterium]|jgi:uncharacterized protein (DUF1501 family)
MKRRQFLQTTGLSLPVLLNGFSLRALAGTRSFATATTTTDRVLVLLQLNGGNDGLAMITPLDQYDPLANARGNILVPASQLLDLGFDNGLHPVMTGIRNLFDDGKVGVVQSVGYPEQNRSHFRSTDIWTSGSPPDQVWTTGWLGRHFEQDHPDFPVGYPNTDFPHPFALTIGSLVTETCQGTGANFSLAINDPFNLNPLADTGGDTVPDTPYGAELTFLRDTIAQTNAYSGFITDAAGMGVNMVTYPDDNRLAQQLRNVARLISGGLQTKVFVVSLGGFDTHANQVLDGSPGQGDHAALLQQLSEAMVPFLADLQAQGLEQRVLTMTFSEFGRRIRSNDSFGTDHGDAAPLLLFGSCVNPGFLGDNPTIPADPDILEALPYQYDFRDVYGTVLTDWFGMAEDTVREVLYDSFTRLPILLPCGPTETSFVPLPSVDLDCSPNPFTDRLSVQLDLHKDASVRLSVHNTLGHLITVLLDGFQPAGSQQLTFDGTRLPPGAYFIRLQHADGQQKIQRTVKLK